MAKILEFKSTRKVTVTVCDSTQNYQTFEAEKASVPTLSFEEHEVWWNDKKANVAGGHSWSPAVIEGPQEIADAIQHGQPPVRVTFEFDPRTDAWWELHEAYLSTKSTENKHVVVFKGATRHEY